MLDLALGKNLLTIIGILYNELCFSIVSTYMLIYFCEVIQLAAIQSGLIIFSGQFCSAIVIPAIQNEINKTSSHLLRSRKSWYIFGTFIVFVSFQLMFTITPKTVENFKNQTKWNGFFVFYLIILAIFNFGSIIVYQVYMVIICDLVDDYNCDRLVIDSLSFIIKATSNIIVNLLLSVTIYISHNETIKFNFDDCRSFKIVVSILNIFGMLYAILHYKYLIDKKYFQKSNIHPITDDDFLRSEDTPFNYRCSSTLLLNMQDIIESMNLKSKINFINLVKIFQFYPVTLSFICGKLCIDIGQIIYIFYLVFYLQINKIVSCLLIGLQSFGALIAIPLYYFINLHLGNKMCMFAAVIFSLIASCWIGLFNRDDMTNSSFYVLSILLSVFLGITVTFIYSSSRDLLIELGQTHIDGINKVIFFTDCIEKVAFAISILFIQYVTPSHHVKNKHQNSNKSTIMTHHFYKFTLVGCIASCSITFFIFLMLLLRTKVGQLNLKQNDDSIDDQNSLINFHYHMFSVFHITFAQLILS